jgi:hypothetical protein
MKLSRFSMPVVFLVLFGCSTSYKVTDYNKSELFKDFNNSAYDSKVEIILNTDSLVIAPEGAEIKNDSILINYPDYYPLKLKKNFSLAEVRQASLKYHWKTFPYGSAAGLFAGIFLGSITSAYILNLKSGGNHPERDYGTGASIGAVSGIIIGAFVGLIVGWDNIYQFAP